MEKGLSAAVSLVMGIMGSIWLVVGLVCAAVLPDPGHLIGAVFALVGAVFLVMMFMMTRMLKRVQEKTYHTVVYGRKIEAQILEVKKETSIQVNGKHPYVVICEKEGRMFESEYFYEDVHRFDQRDTVDVYLDEQSDDYVVDLES